MLTTWQRIAPFLRPFVRLQQAMCQNEPSTCDILAAGHGPCVDNLAMHSRIAFLIDPRIATEPSSRNFGSWTHPLQCSRFVVRGQLEGAARVQQISLSRIAAVEQLLPWVSQNEPISDDFLAIGHLMQWSTPSVLG